MSSIPPDQSCEPAGNLQSNLCYLCQTTWVNFYIFMQCIPPSKETFILPFKSSMFTQWIILNAGWGKNHRARSPPPVIASRGKGLRNGAGRSHTFFWRCMWLLPCHRDGVCFLRGRSWSLLDMLFIRIKRGIRCVTTTFNHSLLKSVDLETVHLGNVF